MFAAINKWLDGKKTVIGGVGLILATVGAYMSGSLATHGIQLSDILPLLKGLSTAMLALGFGGKLQKLIDAYSKS